MFGGNGVWDGEVGMYKEVICWVGLDFWGMVYL